MDRNFVEFVLIIQVKFEGHGNGTKFVGVCEQKASTLGNDIARSSDVCIL
jgi:hypothetical protein